eukprot:1778957-Prymnesium_polylepis.1
MAATLLLAATHLLLVLPSSAQIMLGIKCISTANAHPTQVQPRFPLRWLSTLDLRSALGQALLTVQC